MHKSADGRRYESIDQLGLVNVFIFSLNRYVHSHITAVKTYRISYRSHEILMKCMKRKWCVYLCDVWNANWVFLLWHLFFMRAITTTQTYRMQCVVCAVYCVLRPQWISFWKRCLAQSAELRTFQSHRNSSIRIVITVCRFLKMFSTFVNTKIAEIYLHTTG